jgi:hypothetical protein
LKTNGSKSALFGFGVVPLLLLAMLIFEQSNKQHEIGHIDSAGDLAGNRVVPKGGSVSIFGWAADTADGAPVRSVTVYVDGQAVGAAALGGARLDVARKYARSDFANSGWEFQMPADRLEVGQHTAAAKVVGVSGTALLESSEWITIAPTGGGPR